MSNIECRIAAEQNRIYFSPVAETKPVVESMQVPCNSQVVSRICNFAWKHLFIDTKQGDHIRIRLTLSVLGFLVQAGIRWCWFNPLDKMQSMNAIMTKFGRDVDQLNVYFLGQKT